MIHNMANSSRCAPPTKGASTRPPRSPQNQVYCDGMNGWRWVGHFGGPKARFLSLPNPGGKEATRLPRLESENDVMKKDCNEGRQWKLLNGWMSRGRAAARTHGNQLEDSRLNKTVGRNNDNTNNRLSLNVTRPQEPSNNRPPCGSEGSSPSSWLQQPQQPQPQQRQRLICGTTRRVGREVNHCFPTT